VLTREDGCFESGSTVMNFSRVGLERFDGFGFPDKMLVILKNY
jgi:hypothetical protein